MLGESYFQKRLGDIYEYCLLPYTSGTGRVRADGVDCEVDWELVMDAAGQIILVLGSDSHLNAVNGRTDVEYRLEGISMDATWRIECERLIVEAASYTVGFDSGIRCHLYYCSTYGICLDRQGVSDAHPSVAVAYLRNFMFHGIGFSIDGVTRTRDKFSCSACGRTITFRLRRTAKELEMLTRTGRLRSAVFSTMEYPLQVAENAADALARIDEISWFLGICSLNTNFSPLVAIRDSETVVRMLLLERSCLPYHGNVLIDNFMVKAGIPGFFSQCYAEYEQLSGKFRITEFIDYMLHVENQNHLEIKLALLLMAYENLLTNYLVSNGYSQDEVEGWNIEQKIGKVNAILRFIPKNMQGEDLREKVRNTLFHSGTIPLLTLDEKVGMFDSYHELLVQITLRMLGYQGDYINRLDYNVSTIPSTGSARKTVRSESDVGPVGQDPFVGI